MKDWIMELCPEIAEWQAELIAEQVRIRVEAEREACANLVFNCAWNVKGADNAVLVEKCAEAIRARDTDAVALNDLIYLLEAAPAEPVQEPVAWMTHSKDPLPLFHKTKAGAEAWGAEPQPLYTAPPQQKENSND